jgi:hypothetical protein
VFPEDRGGEAAAELGAFGAPERAAGAWIESSEEGALVGVASKVEPSIGEHGRCGGTELDDGRFERETPLFAA